MRRYRVKGRFFLFLAIILLAAFFIVRPNLRFGEKVEEIRLASSAYTHDMDAVIIRSEQLVTAQSVARIEYVAAENTLVRAGDVVAYLYSTGYSESELKKLESVRKNIQAYHKTMLGNIIDNGLERKELAVRQRATDFKNLVSHKSNGDLISVTRLLETSLVERQEYMRSNMRNDLKLNNLYSQENARLNSISSWRVESTAQKEGVVSFYMDGYEGVLNGGSISDLTIADVRAAIEGRAITAVSPREKSVYRLVDQNKWYTAIITDASVWSPVIDQEYYMQFEGFEDLGYYARVKSVSQSENSILAVFEINSPIGPMIYQRKAKASVSITLTGMSVSVDAIYEENGQKGVWLYDVPGGTFVPVTVLSSDEDMALIEAVVDGSIQIGNRVLIK